MMHLALLPALAAAGIALLLSRRRSTPYRITQAALLIAFYLAGAILVLLSRTNGPCRVVFIRDIPPDAVGSFASSAARVDGIRSEIDSSQKIDEYDVLLVEATDDDASDAPCGRVTGWRWRSAPGAFSGPPARVRYARCAIGAALDRIDDRGLITRVGDLIARRSQRIVFAVDRAERWKLVGPRPKQAQQNGARGRASLIADAITRAGLSGVQIDVVDASDAQAASEPRPELRIDAPPTISGDVSTVEVGLEIEGAGDLRSVDNPTWLRSCAMDPGLPSQAVLPRAPVRPTLADGRLRDRVRLSELRQGDAPLQHLGTGFHLLRCEVQLPWAHDARAVAERYLRVQRRGIILSSQGTQRFVPAGAPAHAIRRLPDEAFGLLRFIGPPWAPELGLQAKSPSDLGSWLKERMLALDSASAPPWASVPAVLALHDFSADWYEKHCAVLEQLVRQGLTLVVSGAPPEKLRGTCRMLPALASTSPGSDTDEERYDRTPRVCVSKDGSRVGELVTSPTTEGGSGLVNASQLTVRPVGAFELQQKFVKDLGAAECGVDVAPAAPEADVVKDACEALVGKARLDARLQAISAKLKSDAFQIGDVVFAFSYAIPQPGTVLPGVEALVTHGSTVVVGLIDTPWSARLQSSTLNGGDCREATTKCDKGRIDCGWIAPSELEKAYSGYIDGVAAAGHLPKWLSAEEAKRRFRVVPIKLEDDKERTALLELLRRLIGTRREARSVFFGPNRHGRFIDTRAGAALPETGRVDPSMPSREDRWAAPERFQRLIATDVLAATFASVYHAPEDSFGLDPRAILIGRPWGAGQVLVAGYSLFEGVDTPSVFETQAPEGATVELHRRINPRDPPGRSRLSDAWGIRRIADAARFAWNLLPSPGDSPVLLNLERDAIGHHVDLTVLQHVAASKLVHDLPALSRCDPQAKDEWPAPNCPPVGETVHLALVRLDFVQNRLTYRLLPSGAKTLCGDALACVASLGGLPFYVRNDARDEEAVVPDLGRSETLSTVAAFTGGQSVARRDVKQLKGAPTSLRLHAALGVLGSLALLLGLRLWRRLAALWAFANRVGENRRRRHRDTPDGAVASAGDALSRPTDARIGAFAGANPLEPGDRLQGIAPSDLLALAVEERPRGVPRVVRRFEDRARRIWFIVTTGQSMRLPRTWSRSPKIESATLVVETLSRVAWRGGAEVTVHAEVGGAIVGSLGPLGAPPSSGAIERFLVEARGGRSRFDYPLKLGEVPDGTIVVFVSDFLLVDLDTVARLSADLDEARGALAGVLVQAEEDAALVDLGVAVDARMLCDRSELTASELKEAQRSFASVVEARLGAAAGGVVRVTTATSSEEILLVVKDSGLGGLLS